MGLRGPKPRTKTRNTLQDKLRCLMPDAIERISESARGKDLPPGVIDNAWKIVYQIDGKPSQRVEMSYDRDNPLTIQVVRESLPDYAPLQVVEGQVRELPMPQGESEQSHIMSIVRTNESEEPCQ